MRKLTEEEKAELCPDLSHYIGRFVAMFWITLGVIAVLFVWLAPGLEQQDPYNDGFASNIPVEEQKYLVWWSENISVFESPSVRREMLAEYRKKHGLPDTSPKHKEMMRFIESQGPSLEPRNGE